MKSKIISSNNFSVKFQIKSKHSKTQFFSRKYLLTIRFINLFGDYLLTARINNNLRTLILME